jgi:hypothetical protein
MERSPSMGTNPGLKVYQTILHVATMINILLGREYRGAQNHTHFQTLKFKYTVGKVEDTQH